MKLIGIVSEKLESSSWFKKQGCQMVFLKSAMALPILGWFVGFNWDWPRQPKPDGRIKKTGRPKINNQTAEPNGRIWPYGQKLKYYITVILWYIV